MGMENENSGDIEGPEGPVSPVYRPEPGMDVEAGDTAETPQSSQGKSRQKRRKPYTEARMMADALKHHQNLEEAIERHGPRLFWNRKAALSPKAKEAIRDLRRNQAHWLGYMNPYARLATFEAQSPSPAH